ncbi:MAG: Si-specific NAD(P)(+) transhydrogenase, partial [Deltaproteobacteria bacterium]|nr:Si-specific NAD(P)(+) transhydrogenase [Deltaproteobacteria bacterium]
RRNEATASLADRLDNTLRRNGVELTRGTAVFTSANSIQVHPAEGDSSGGGESYEAPYFVIATGSRPWHPDNLDFSHPLIRDSDTILGLKEIPRSLTIIGAGVIGCEYASIFSHLGVKLNLVNPRQELLDFLDLEISNALAYLMREQGVRIRLGETLESATVENGQVLAHMASGKIIKSDVLLFANGRTGNTDSMGLETIPLQINQRRQIEVNEYFQTSQPHIFAVGDVIGPPALASTAMEQGRIAALNAFGNKMITPRLDLLPTGIYTIPEISMVGATEEQLTAERVPYEVGAATYREIARGQISGNTTGRLKLLFHRETLALLGVHVIGDQAGDLVHLGQTVMAFGGTLEYFVNQVLNYPTYSECYRVAALNGINRL